MTRPDRISARSTAFESSRGLALLRDPLLNKGTAFSEKERDAFDMLLSKLSASTAAISD